MHQRYADPEAASTTDQTREIAAALRNATAAVDKRETFGAARAAVAAALEQDDYAAAHRAREDLVHAYDDLKTDRDVRKLKADTLAAEAAAVTPIAEAEAPPPSPVAPPAALAPVFVSQSSTGEATEDSAVLTRAGPSLYAVDTITAEPLWRAAVSGGSATPIAPVDAASTFPPVEADSAGAALLICDTIRPALLSVDGQSGAINWRAPLPASPTGPPRSAGGQVLIGCEDGSLLAVDPTTGRVTGGLKFPQAVLSPPAAAGGAGASAGGRLLLAGARNTVYTLSGNPPALEAISYTGHGAGAIPVPLQPIGRYVLMCDNDRADGALLRAFEFDPDPTADGTAKEVGRSRVLRPD